MEADSENKKPTYHQGMSAYGLRETRQVSQHGALLRYDLKVYFWVNLTPL